MNSDDTDGLFELYAVAIIQAERALEVVEELITIVQGDGDCEFQSMALRTHCAQLAETDARIQAAQSTVSLEHNNVAPQIMADAERHLRALSKLCERIRHAERIATNRLQTLSPGLDASIRGTQMVTAYRQRRA